MPNALKATRTTFSDTQDGDRTEELCFAARAGTTPLATDTRVPSAQIGSSGEYVTSVVDGLRTWIELQRASSLSGEFMLDEAYEPGFRVASLLSRSACGAEGGRGFSPRWDVGSTIRVSLLDAVPTFVPSVVEQMSVLPETIEEVDWDVQIETPPKRDSVEVVLMFEEGAYRPPRIVDDPEA